MSIDFDRLRREYRHAALDESAVEGDPMRQFDAWFRDVLALGLELPNAMVLATAGTDAAPSARCVLLKEYDSRGFVFYSSAHSGKGRQLAENPRAALLFYWEPLHRQVRAEGPVELLPEAEAAAYFHSRPYPSRVSAQVAVQSSVVPGREFMEARHAELDRQYRGGSVPPPPGWSGFRVRPEYVEFWQGRENRLHDRLCYRRAAAGSWEIARLAP